MARVYEVEASLVTQYRGTGNTLSRQSAPATIGGYTGYHFGTNGNYNYGIAARFTKPSIPSSANITKLTWVCLREKALTDITYSVQGYFSIPTTSVSGSMRTGYAEITTNRTGYTVSGEAGQTDPYDVRRNIPLTLANQLFNYGIVWYHHDQSRVARFSNFRLLVETDESASVKIAINNGIREGNVNSIIIDGTARQVSSLMVLDGGVWRNV